MANDRRGEDGHFENYAAQVLGAENRTGMNQDERGRTTNCYPLLPWRIGDLSKELAVGNLAGKDATGFYNNLKLLRKFPAFESSPGHQFFVVTQYIITL